MIMRNPLAIGALALPLLLTGCGLLPTTRHLPVPKPPALVQTATPEELVQQTDKRWNDFQTLTATVEIQATLLKQQQGLATDYPSIRGWIVMQKPSYLRVVGQYLGVRVFNMASNGQTFTLLIPPKNKAIEGSNSVVKKSANQFENLRPGFFFDAMMVRALDPDDYYARIADTETIEDAAKKHLYTMPEYVLSITQHASNGGRVDKPVRVITFHRDDLLPSNQDLYDNQGNLESQVSYSAYKDFGGSQYPTRVVIRRPLEGIQLVLTVEKVVKNQKLPPDEFTVEIPPGTQVQHLDHADSSQ
jgi:outer membrane lipoprotein-sorting protein